MKIRNRIKELRFVPASELLPNPKNWRTHSGPQKDALKGILAEVGIAGAVIARETKNGLMLIDGHLRAETIGTDKIPVLVLDVTEEESDKLLATLDPIGAMAGIDANQLEKLLAEVNTENKGIEKMLASLAVDAGLVNVDNVYTEKTEGFTYTPKTEKPSIESLVDMKKTNELIQQIQLGNLPEAEKTFLIAAAYRHAVFNYESVAEYYSHSDENMQHEMEASALVIVDFGDAIAQGYVTLCSAMSDIYSLEKGPEVEK